MIPPRIKKLPNLHKPKGYVQKPQMSSSNSNRSLYMGGAKMIYDGIKDVFEGEAENMNPYSNENYQQQTDKMMAKMKNFRNQKL